MNYLAKSGSRQAALLACTALAMTLPVSQAFAQETATPPAAKAPAAATQVDASQDQSPIADIVVTAQRREQNLQDVPIAITAITQNSLLANRVTSVQDLSGLAPNFTVRPSAGGIGLPSFTMRGITSYGVVPGSDKEISIYLDGVYLGNPRGSAFELPDIERIEVLRGPQGTLFGRNATAGAVSIVTRDPTGVQGARQDFTIGNYNQVRIRTTVDLPAIGPFSAYGTHVWDKRDGDIRNLGAGTIWDRSGPGTNATAQISPRTLGSKDAESWFAALKFEPVDNFNMVYKFDHTSNTFSPEGTGLVGINPASPLIGPLLAALVAGTPTLTQGQITRPDAVNNSFTVDTIQRSTGHSLTANWKASDSITVKNIAAYRTTFINSAFNLDGLGGTTLTPGALTPYAVFVAFSTIPGLASAPPATQGAAIAGVANALVPAIGSRFCVLCNQSQSSGKQWSDELQATYNSSFVTLTVGALYFHQEDVTGGPPGMANNLQFTPLPNSGRLPLGNEATTYSKGTSYAAYAQAEFQVTPKIAIIAGGRITHDNKSGTFVSGGTFTPGSAGISNGTFSGQKFTSYTYSKTKPTYSIGVNWKPSNDLLFYGKYATAYVSGGQVADTAPFLPETVSSIELGAKGDFFDRRLRTNIALFHARYDHIQSAQGGTNVGRPDLSTLIVDGGTTTAQGVEFEATVAPVTGLSLVGSFGYTDIKLNTVNPVIVLGAGGTRIVPSGIPAYTAKLVAQYQTPELFNGAHLLFRADANWQSRRQNDPNPDRATAIPAFAAIASTPPFWIVNGRVALQDFNLGSAGKVEIAGWARNLFDNKTAMYPLILSTFVANTTYVPARTYGIDLMFKF